MWFCDQAVKVITVSQHGLSLELGGLVFIWKVAILTPKVRSEDPFDNFVTGYMV